MAGARSRNFEGWPLFANSFRPFFLLAAIQAGLSILAWLPMFYGELSVSSAFAPRDWHVHEMLYGFLPAVITGFLFTAIPNWTGRLPIQGTSLGALLVVWLAGRFAVAGQYFEVQPRLAGAAQLLSQSHDAAAIRAG